MSFRAQRGICEASRLALQAIHCLQRCTVGRAPAPLRHALYDSFRTFSMATAMARSLSFKFRSDTKLKLKHFSPRFVVRATGGGTW
jgi:hypothetical protein